ncbi:MAG TPA: ABC transporter permease [Vicinamibacterales bacterium]|nr:ABC transporter permease [Vicinamibacterales bacterium]
MTNLLQDLGYALKSFRKRPAFAITAIATLGLGIGVTTAIFSVVSTVLLKPLPYQDPSTLVHIASDMRARNVEDFPFPPADFADLRAQGTMFSGVASLVTGRQVLPTEHGDFELVRTGGATPNLFRVLGARVVEGRDFTEAEGTPPAAPPQAPQGAAAGPPPQQPPPTQPTIISHEFWQRRFGGDRAILNQVVQLAPPPAPRFLIVGVLEPGFALLYPPNVTNIEKHVDLWTPLAIDFAAGSRINVFLRVIARLKPGVTVPDAQGQVDAIAADLRRQFPIKETAGVHWRVEPMHEDLVAEVRPSILALMGAVVFVLLIACANVANLMLVRAAARERELAVRSALGSSRLRIVRQLLAESLVLAAGGALLGLALAWAGIRVLVAVGPEDLPRLEHVTIDAPIVLFATGVAALSSIVFGLIPAVRASRPDVMDLLRRSGRQGSLAGGRWLRNGVVIAEVALSFVLLVGSGLMIRSFVALQRAEPGFDTSSALTFLVPNLPLPQPQARQAFQRDLKARLEGLPGVTAVTAANPFPLDGGIANARWGTEEAASDPAKFQQADVRVVLPGYFDAMRTRLIEGRTYSEADSRPELRELVIDRVLARKAFGSAPAVGRTLLFRINSPEAQPYRIAGVVDHQRHTTLASEGRETVYVPDGFFGFGAANRWMVRASGDPMQLAGAVKAALRDLDPRVGAIEIQPIEALVREAQAETRFALLLIGVFAAIAVVLASVGLYSVLSTVVRMRTAEIGVRMAFGAERGSIFRMMVGQGLKLSAAGIVVGVFVALLLVGAMRSMLVGVEPTDPATFAVIALMFLLIAIVACGVPALRAARLNPLTALREE